MQHGRSGYLAEKDAKPTTYSLRNFTYSFEIRKVSLFTTKKSLKIFRAEIMLLFFFFFFFFFFLFFFFFVVLLLLLFCFFFFVCLFFCFFLFCFFLFVFFCGQG